MKTPKELRKISDGRIFAYTDALARRPDMVPVWGPGEEPEYPSDSKGLDIGAGAEDHLKKTLRKQTETIMNLENQLSVIGEENQKLLDRIDELEKQASAKSDPDESEDRPPHDDLPDETRLKILVEKTAEMIRRGDKNDFTGQGLPRVERLEAISGIAEVTGSERNMAYDAAQKIIADE